MQAARANRTQAHNGPSVAQSNGPSKVAVSSVRKLPLYTASPVIRLSPAPRGPAQAGLSPQVAQLINSPGAGSSLQPEIQDRLENSLQADLQDVRVHTDARTTAVVDNLPARAFTYGPNIFLGSGERATDLAL